MEMLPLTFLNIGRVIVYTATGTATFLVTRGVWNNFTDEDKKELRRIRKERLARETREIAAREAREAARDAREAARDASSAASAVTP